MDVRGHNMYERNSLSRIKMKKFTVHPHLRASSLVLAQCWPNIFQTYRKASTALEGMVKHKVRLTNSFQAGCQMMPEVSIYQRNVPGISAAHRAVHQQSISSRLRWSWLLIASSIVSCCNFGTCYYRMVWFYIGLFSIRPECESIEATAPSPAACSCARSRKALHLWGQKKGLKPRPPQLGFNEKPKVFVLI